jgi:hypothetical protein
MHRSKYFALQKDCFYDGRRCYFWSCDRATSGLRAAHEPDRGRVGPPFKRRRKARRWRHRKSDGVRAAGMRLRNSAATPRA